MATFVSSSTGQSQSTTSLSLTLPTGLTTGDILITAVAINNATTVITPPNGWIALDGAPVSSGSFSGGIWYRFYTGSQPPLTWELAAAQKVSAVIVAYRGVDSGTPFSVGVDGTRGVSSTDTVAPALTTTASYQEVLGIFLSKENNVTTASTPSGMTLRAAAMTTGGGAVTAHVFSQTFVAPGSTGNETVTYDTASGSAYGVLLALHDTVAVPVTVFKGWGTPLILTPTIQARFLGDPGVNKFYFGGAPDTITWPDRETAIANWESRMSPWSGGVKLGVMRVYELAPNSSTGLSAAAMSQMSEHYTNHRQPHISFKLPSDITTTDAANQTGNFATWMTNLASCFESFAPNPVWWTFWHEPEGDLDATEYRAACRNIRTAIKNLGVTNDVFWTTCFICPWTFGAKGNTSGDWRTWYPDWKGTTASGSSKDNPNPVDFYLPGDPNAVCDGIGLDVYSWWDEGEPLSNFDSFATLTGWATSRMNFLNLPYIIAEHGVQAYHTGTVSGGDAVFDPSVTLDYIAGISTVMAQNNIVALEVYNYSLVQPAWQLEVQDPQRIRYQGYGTMLADGAVVLPDL